MNALTNGKRKLLIDQKEIVNVQCVIIKKHNRAKIILEQLEENNIIGPIHGSKPREVLIKNND